MKHRRFLAHSARVLAAGSVSSSFAIGKPGKSANSKLNVAFIGSGGWVAQQRYCLLKWATRVTRIEWDAIQCRITNHPELNAFIKEPVREGWQYDETL